MGQVLGLKQVRWSAEPGGIAILARDWGGKGMPLGSQWNFNLTNSCKLRFNLESPNASDICGKTQLVAVSFAKSSFFALVHHNLW